MQFDSRLIGLLVVIVVALVLSVFANVYFIKQSRHYFREFNRVRLNPLGSDELHMDAVAGEANARQIVVVGDSRAAAWPAPAGLPDFSFVNWGVNGHTAVQANLRYNLNRDQLHPDIVIIQVGINDLIPLQAFPTEKSQIIDSCQQSIAQIVGHARKTGTTVILTTIFPLQTPKIQDRIYWSDDIFASITQVNAYIRSLEAENVYVLDAHDLLADESGRLKDVYAEDYLHINQDGYNIINKALLLILSQL